MLNRPGSWQEPEVPWLEMPGTVEEMEALVASASGAPGSGSQSPHKAINMHGKKVLWDVILAIARRLLLSSKGIEGSLS